jgi:hypothetical protein
MSIHRIAGCIESHACQMRKLSKMPIGRNVGSGFTLFFQTLVFDDDWPTQSLVVHRLIGQVLGRPFKDHWRWCWCWRFAMHPVSFKLEDCVCAIFYPKTLLCIHSANPCRSTVKDVIYFIEWYVLRRDLK